MNNEIEILAIKNLTNSINNLRVAIQELNNKLDSMDINKELVPQKVQAIRNLMEEEKRKQRHGRIESAAIDALTQFKAGVDKVKVTRKLRDGSLLHDILDAESVFDKARGVLGDAEDDEKIIDLIQEMISDLGTTGQEVVDALVE